MARKLSNADITRLKERKIAPVKSRTAVFATAKAMSLTLQGNPNWVATAQWTNDTGSPISSFEASWVVPPPPTAPDRNQIIFLFIGIGNASFILQPILVWQSIDNPANANWFVAGMISTGQNAPATINGQQQVASGTTIKGIITLESSDGSGFVYSCQLDQYPATLTQTDPMPELKQVFVVLESYRINKNRTYYPPIDATTIMNPLISTRAGIAAPTWQMAPPGPLGEFAALGNQGNGPDITLNY